MTKIFYINLNHKSNMCLMENIKKSDFNKIEGYFSLDIRESFFNIISRICLYRYIFVEQKINNGFPVEKKNSFGKPYFLNYPEIKFNISHTREALLIGISNKYKIGVDIEKLEYNPYHHEISEIMFVEKERNILYNIKDDLERSRKFIELWTKKEAYSKYLGIGLGLFFEPKYSKFIKKENEVNLRTFYLDDYCVSICVGKERSIFEWNKLSLLEVLSYTKDIEEMILGR